MRQAYQTSYPFVKFKQAI